MHLTKKTRINPLVQEQETPTPAQKIYKTAAYVRLSVEDSGKPGADTIEGQKALLMSYIESKQDMELVRRLQGFSMMRGL